MKNVRRFFEEYSAASLRGKSLEVATYYAQTFMVATRNEAVSFTNDQKFLEWLDGVAAFNKKSGMTDMQVVRVETSAVGEYHINATVTWGVKFAKSPDKLIEFDIHYLLNHSAGDYKIVLYISDEDQQELMKKEGVI